MEQWNRELLELNSRLWVDAMNSTENFSAEIRPKDDIDNRVDVNAFNAGMGSSTERIEKALSCIKARGYLGKNMTALDIGSGNGIFTLPFAKQYKQVTALDVNLAMQNEIKRRALELGINNIDYLHVNWRDLDLDAADMLEKYDLVLCSINPRGVCNWETLNKMNQASKGGCCLMTFAGRGKSNHGGDLQRIILGRNLSTTGGNNIIFPFNVVYHMGGEPDMAYTSVHWEHSMKPEEAIDGICFSYWRFAEITEEIRERVSDYVYSHLEDGQYIDRVENLIGIMVWDAWKTRQNG